MSLTVKEVVAKEAQLNIELSTALEAAKVLTPATSEFDEAYGRYLSAKANIAKIPNEIAQAKLSENAVAIAASGVTLAETIAKVLTGLKIEELLGVPVKNLTYAVDSEGVRKVVFNPTIHVKSTSGAKGEPKGGRTMIVAPDGARLSCTKFVEAHITDAEKSSADFKYPHTVIDSKPKFEAFCTARNLVGYVYDVPGKSDTAVSETPTAPAAPVVPAPATTEAQASPPDSKPETPAS